MIFSKDADTYASFEKIYDADGTVWIDAVAANALVAKTPYFIIGDEFGPKAISLSDITPYCYIGFPAKAWDSGGVARIQIGGLIEDAVTPELSIAIGHAVKLDGGAIADADADYTGTAGQFGVCATASTTSTTQDLMLVPERILCTT